MKKFNFAVFALFMFVAVSCGSGQDSKGSGANQESTESTEMSDKEHNSKYICPMHCEGSGSDHPGDCPVCHMHYVENKDYQSPK